MDYTQVVCLCEDMKLYSSFVLYSFLLLIFFLDNLFRKVSKFMEKFILKIVILLKLLPLNICIANFPIQIAHF